jgi:hypothetical protein
LTTLFQLGQVVQDTESTLKNVQDTLLSNLSKGTDHSVPLLTAAIEFSLAFSVTHVLYTRLIMLRHYFSVGVHWGVGLTQ